MKKQYHPKNSKLAEFFWNHPGKHYVWIKILQFLFKIRPGYELCENWDNYYYWDNWSDEGDRHG